MKLSRKLLRKMILTEMSRRRPYQGEQQNKYDDLAQDIHELFMQVMRHPNLGKMVKNGGGIAVADMMGQPGGVLDNMVQAQLGYEVSIRERMYVLEKLKDLIRQT